MCDYLMSEYGCSRREEAGIRLSLVSRGTVALQGKLPSGTIITAITKSDYIHTQSPEPAYHFHPMHSASMVVTLRSSKATVKKNI